MALLSLGWRNRGKCLIHSRRDANSLVVVRHTCRYFRRILRKCRVSAEGARPVTPLRVQAAVTSELCLTAALSAGLGRLAVTPVHGPAAPRRKPGRDSGFPGSAAPHRKLARRRAPPGHRTGSSPPGPASPLSGAGPGPYGLVPNAVLGVSPTAANRMAGGRAIPESGGARRAGPGPRLIRWPRTSVPRLARLSGSPKAAS
jgi:hypothetical protein